MVAALPRDTRNIYECRAHATAGSLALGLRERHKIDKLDRISDAAHLLFARDGYERTTLRDIAKEADVALGTLSVYARDKRDLILLIFNKLIPPLLDQGRRNTARTAKLATNLVSYFEPYYRTFADDTTLYRVVLGQIYSGPPSIHADQNERIRRGLIEAIEDLILQAGAAGEIAIVGDQNLAARSFYYIYFAAVRSWLSSAAPDADAGLADLEALFTLLISGMPRHGSPTGSSGSTSG